MSSSQSCNSKANQNISLVFLKKEREKSLSPHTHREKKVGFKWRLCVIIHVKFACTSFKLNQRTLVRQEEWLFMVKLQI